jgi:DNA-binding MarR family transcriptional regulator
MTRTLEDMGKGSGCAPGSMVLMSRLAKQFYRRSDEQQLGMQLRHLVALAYVRDHDGCPQQDLADAFCMDANNVVLLLNELEQLGFATRVRDPLDRRPALASTEAAQGAIEDQILQALEPDERRTLRELLSRALRSMEPVAEQPVGEQRDPTGEERPAGGEQRPYSATTASIST